MPQSTVLAPGGPPWGGGAEADAGARRGTGRGPLRIQGAGGWQSIAAPRFPAQAGRPAHVGLSPR